MSVLLDTHVFFWLVRGSSKLTPKHRELIEDRHRAMYLSAVSGWEIAIKVRLGKWPEAAELVPGLADVAERSGLQTLDLTLVQAELAGLLPLAHRDPFDRMLAAQALDLDLAIATVDPVFATLGCKVI